MQARSTVAKPKPAGPQSAKRRASPPAPRSAEQVFRERAAEMLQRIQERGDQLDKKIGALLTRLG